MTENIISKKTMRCFLEHLSHERTLIGPVDTGKVIEYRETTVNYILMNDLVSYKSIKACYFPQTELMFTFEGDNITDNSSLPGYVIFGAKPCDLEALRVMSIVYSTGKYADPFFLRRFEANLVIGVGCITMKPGCFCNEMGVDKGFSDFCDIMLAEAGDKYPEESYIVTHLSEKGRRALKDFPDTSGIKLSNDRSALTSDTLEDKKIKLDVDTDDTYYFDIIDWEKVTKMCKGCGICTYICPTCYCFDFKDVTEKGCAKRYKCWDSCMYPKFTLHASGHNPRDKRHERYRQRVLHKYKYVPNNFDGAVACTGCGRCIRSCPVGINIKDIVKQVLDEK